MFPVQKFLLLIVSLYTTRFKVKLINSPIFQILKKILGDINEQEIINKNEKVFVFLAKMICSDVVIVIFME